MCIWQICLKPVTDYKTNTDRMVVFVSIGYLLQDVEFVFALCGFFSLLCHTTLYFFCFHRCLPAFFLLELYNQYRYSTATSRQYTDDFSSFLTQHLVTPLQQKITMGLYSPRNKTQNNHQSNLYDTDYVWHVS